ncbi:MAG: membrane dipeptidase [Thermoflexales bacterium]
MLIFDGDYPMAYGALDLNRDLTLTIEAARAQPDKDPATQSPNAGIMATLPEMRRGCVAAALVKVVGRIKRIDSPLWGYASGHSAYAAAQAGLAYYRILERQAHARILRTRDDFVSHMAQWQAAQARGEDTANLPVGFVLGMEGADPILWPEHVGDWWVDGLRVVSLTHYGVSTYAHGTGTAGGLTDKARPLLREMERIGMILDVTHLADQSFWEALDVYAGPVIASHQNCRALVPGERQFSDQQLRAVIGRGGVIGASMDSWMLHIGEGLDWTKAGVTNRRAVFERRAVTLEHVADHIDRVCQLAGNARHAAIGGDTDGQGGADGAPADVDTVADYQKLEKVLNRRGYASYDVEDIFIGNWARFYLRWLPGPYNAPP